jgi:hypothetical protein
MPTIIIIERPAGRGMIFLGSDTEMKTLDTSGDYHSYPVSRFLSSGQTVKAI